MRHLAPALLLPPLLPACDGFGLFIGSGCADPCTVSTRVEGQVVDSRAVPVPGAEIRLRPLYLGVGNDRCVETATRRDGELVVFVEAGDRGQFSARLEARAVDRPDCVEIRADPPAGVSLTTGTDTIRASWVPPARAVPVTHVTVVLYPP